MAVPGFEAVLSTKVDSKTDTKLFRPKNTAVLPPFKNEEETTYSTLLDDATMALFPWLLNSHWQIKLGRLVLAFFTLTAGLSAEVFPTPTNVMPCKMTLARRPLISICPPGPCIMHSSSSFCFWQATVTLRRIRIGPSPDISTANGHKFTRFGPLLPLISRLNSSYVSIFVQVPPDFGGAGQSATSGNPACA